MTLNYNIYAFEWDKSNRTFICNTPIHGLHPTDRKQFYIINGDTGGFRRFRHVFTGEVDNEIYNQFISEDGIYCRIKAVE
jgi:hypothetical protein